jgi:hypothetical protein
VAENGAVVYFPRRETITLPYGRLDPRVLQRLEIMNVPLERGMVIAATVVPHDEAILKALRDSKSSANVEYNRDSVMLLPPGATKGTGLRYALTELGYSLHNVVACGDAENDRSCSRPWNSASPSPTRSPPSKPWPTRCSTNHAARASRRCCWICSMGAHPTGSRAPAAVC